MAFYKNICLIEAPQVVVTPFPRFITDCIGICYLAAAVEDIVDSLVIPENYYNDGLFDSFRSLLKKQPIDLVAISSMTGGFNNAVGLARIAKEHGKYVVMGGFHPTSLPEEVLKLDCVDLIAIGEGEATFRELVQNGPSRDIKGLAWRENGEVVYTGMRELIMDVDSIRYPLRALRPERFGEKGDDYTIDTIYTSRGCPWSCSFCANDKMHKQWRGRSAENVVDEIAKLHDPKKKKLLKIWDANFLTNIKRAEAICDLMIDRGLTNFRIMTETRAKDVVRAERILGKLNSVGLKKVGLGIESPNPQTLELMNKKNSLDDVSKAIGLLTNNHIGAEGYFIIGHHSETEQDTMTYPEFAKSLGLRQALFMAMTPYPGTKIFEEYRSEGNITSSDWDLYNNFTPVIKTAHLDTAALVRMLAYCNVAFCNYRSLLKRDSERGVLIVFLRDLFQLVFLLRVNKDLDRQEVGQIIFDAFVRYLGTNPRIEYRDSPPLPVMKQPYVVSVEHSSGQRVDFIIRQQGDGRAMTMKKVSASDPVTGPVISLDEVVNAAWSISMDILMRILYRNELMRNNPGLTVRQLIALFTDSDVRKAGVKLAGLYRNCVRKKSRARTNRLQTQTA
ncbi:MAG: B12-binding domain-containing radical SAM protein [Chlorobiaceae bacterium]|nr:B12-binding domain-containing radical SAM protein [Chlorobiaceae bacterium]